VVPVVPTTGGGGGAGPELFGAVRFEAGVTRRVRDIVITFDSAESADRFALEHGWGEDYQVAALRFFVEELPATPLGGSRLHLDRALARARRAGVP
jgi:hypothetical protein